MAIGFDCLANGAIFRAKIDKKNRLIFTYVPHKEQATLLILAVNNHNYKKIKRQFIEPGTQYQEVIALGDLNGYEQIIN